MITSTKVNWIHHRFPFWILLIYPTFYYNPLISTSFLFRLKKVFSYSVLGTAAKVSDCWDASTPSQTRYWLMWKRTSVLFCGVLLDVSKWGKLQFCGCWVFFCGVLVLLLFKNGGLPPNCEKGNIFHFCFLCNFFFFSPRQSEEFQFLTTAVHL